VRVLVVGAGLSGLAAALELARGGAKVTLAERRAFPGGRTYSFEGPDGEEIDNGQHVFLHCCTAYRTFVEEIGAGHLVRLQPRTKVPMVDGRTGRSWTMRPTLLSLLCYRPLSWRERTGALRCAKEMMAADCAAFDDVTMGQWLRERGQSDNAIRTFWEVPVLGVLNERVDRVSASAALFFFQTGFFGSSDASRIGFATVGLGRIARKAVEAIKAAGGEVKFGERVERLEGYDAYVPAVPAKALLELLAPEQRAMEFFARAEGMPTSPIVNVHVKFDRPVWGRPFAAFVGSPLQWVFNRTLIAGQGGGGTRLTVSLSGARERMEETSAEIERRIVEELRRLLPDARDARLMRAVVVREPEATFVCAPGTRVKRLPCETPLPGVFLAGEWTESEWPSTMEAAVRSGVRAAKAVLARRTP